MGRFASGIAVVTVQWGEEMHAMTASSLTSVSLEPPLLLVCLTHGSRTLERVRQSGGFAVNVLGAGQEALSDYFAGRKVASPEYRLVPYHGGPRLVAAMVTLGCHLERLIEAGDHDIALGRVTAIAEGDEAREPLVFFRSRYARLTPLAAQRSGEVQLGGSIDLPFYQEGDRP